MGRRQAPEREKGINKKKMIAMCYNAVSKIRAHCSSIAKILAYAIFDGVNFWIINAKKYTILNENALSDI